MMMEVMGKKAENGNSDCHHHWRVRQSGNERVESERFLHHHWYLVWFCHYKGSFRWCHAILTPLSPESFNFLILFNISAYLLLLYRRAPFSTFLLLLFLFFFCVAMNFIYTHTDATLLLLWDTFLSLTHTTWHILIELKRTHSTLSFFLSLSLLCVSLPTLCYFMAYWKFMMRRAI